MYRLLLNLIFLCFLISPAVMAGPEDIIAEYIDHLKNGQWDRARNCWHPEDIRKSERLGITYRNTPLKIDCASPLINALDGIRADLVQIETSTVTESDSTARVIINLSYNEQQIQVPYHTISDGKQWFIISTLSLLTANWSDSEGEFVVVHFNDSSLYNNYAANVLDRDISNLGKTLGFGEQEFERLRSRKIDYYLCTEDEFVRLTGYNAHGLTVLPFDAVVTRHLPHPHELAHLLINYSLHDLPLYTVPFIQEGLAVAFGGRWGKSPAVIKQLGYTILENEMFTLEDILTYDDFYNKIGSPDISYPIAGIFVEMLIDQIGIDKFKGLYLDLSGTETNISAMTRSDIIAKIERDSGLLWENLLHLFNEQWPRYEYSGLIPGSAGSNSVRGERDGIFFESDYRIAKNNEYYQFEIDFTENHESGVLLLKKKEDAARHKSSSLFMELVPGIEYTGWEYGIIFDRNEIGLYDFRTNILLAKHVENFAPGRGYIHNDINENMYLFRISPALIENGIAEYEPRLVYFNPGR